MTPNPKDPRFIIHCVPADASVNLRFFYDEFLRITQNADTGKWLGVTAENFAFEYYYCPLKVEGGKTVCLEH